MNLKLFMPVSSTIFFGTLARKKKIAFERNVDYLQRCYSFSKSLLTSAQFSENQEGKNASDTFVTIWICNHNKDTRKGRSKPTRGERLRPKQAGEPRATARVGPSLTGAILEG